MVTSLLNPQYLGFTLPSNGLMNVFLLILEIYDRNFFSLSHFKQKTKAQE